MSGAPGGRAAGLVAAGILVSRLAGFVRTWFAARYLGASAAQDAYTMALRVPNALRNLLGEGTLSAAFVPVYSALLARDDERGARALAQALLGVLLAGVSVLTLLGIALAPLLTAVLAAGFDADRAALTTRLIRVLFPMAGLMVLSGWCLGVQNAHRRFFLAYASAAMWSVAQIALLAGWGGRAASLAELAWWLAWATLAGALLQVAVQVPEVWRLAGPVRPTLGLGESDVRAVLGNLVPVIGALGVVQLSGFADGFIAAFLTPGSVSVLGYANQLMLLPVALFGIAVSASSLPELSRDGASLAGEAARAAVRTRVRDGLVRICFYVVPSAVVFIGFGDLVIGLLLRSGQFGLREQALVHGTLAAYAVGLVAFSSNRLFAAVFHARQDYRSPLRFSMLSVAASIACAAALALVFRSHELAVAGIALGAALGSWLNFTLLSGRLREELGPLLSTSARATVGRIVGASAVAALGAGLLRALTDGWHRWLEGPLVLGVFALLYLAVSWWFGSAEAARWLRVAPRRTSSGDGAGA
jgi:putative peptidoglycan lipid II flippase